MEDTDQERQTIGRNQLGRLLFRYCCTKIYIGRVVTGWLRESDFGRLVGLIVTGWLRVSDDFGRLIGRSVTGWLQGSDFGRLVGLILSDWMDVRV